MMGPRIHLIGTGDTEGERSVAGPAEALEAGSTGYERRFHSVPEDAGS